MRKVRVLLDEQLDVKLKDLFADDFEVATVREQRWNGYKNGRLLRAAQKDFDVLVTLDQNLQHQQNLRSVDLGIVVIRSKSSLFDDVAPLIPEVNEAIRAVQPKQLVVVSAG